MTREALILPPRAQAKLAILHAYGHVEDALSELAFLRHNFQRELTVSADEIGRRLEIAQDAVADAVADMLTADREITLAQESPV